MQTSFGIYPLKCCFGDGYTTEDGEEMAVREIRKILKECIDNEDKKKPLTDDELADILKEKGYILNYKFEQEGARSNIKIALKYHPETKVPAIKSLVRVSKPGLRRYTNVEEMPRVLNGLVIAILSTSIGLMTDKEARQRNVGGELLCYVY